MNGLSDGLSPQSSRPNAGFPRSLPLSHRFSSSNPGRSSRGRSGSSPATASSVANAPWSTNRPLLTSVASATGRRRGLSTYSRNAPASSPFVFKPWVPPSCHLPSRHGSLAISWPSWQAPASRISNWTNPHWRTELTQPRIISTTGPNSFNMNS